MTLYHGIRPKNVTAVTEAASVGEEQETADGIWPDI